MVVNARPSQENVYITIVELHVTVNNETYVRLRIKCLIYFLILVNFRFFLIGFHKSLQYQII